MFYERSMYIVSNLVDYKWNQALFCSGEGLLRLEPSPQNWCICFIVIKICHWFELHMSLVLVVHVSFLAHLHAHDVLKIFYKNCPAAIHH